LKLKFYTVAEKTAKNFRGLLFAVLCICSVTGHSLVIRWLYSVSQLQIGSRITNSTSNRVSLLRGPFCTEI